MGKKLGKSEKSSLAGVDFDELNHKVMGVSKNIKGPKKTPHGPVQGRFMSPWHILRSVASSPAI